MNKKQYNKIKKTFEKGFKHWNIKLPKEQFPGVINVGKEGWDVKAVLNEDGLEYIAHHRMTNSRHEKIDLDGNPYGGGEGFGTTMICLASSQEEYDEMRNKFLTDQESLYVRLKEVGLANFEWWEVPSEKFYTMEEKQARMIKFAEKSKALRSGNRNANT
jgi:hypothetical protein